MKIGKLTIIEIKRIDPLFKSKLNRIKTIPRSTMHIVVHTLKAVGIDLEGLTLSTSSRYIALKGARKEIEENVKNTFNWSTLLIAHSGNKLLRHNDREISDQVAVLVPVKKLKDYWLSKDAI